MQETYQYILAPETALSAIFGRFELYNFQKMDNLCRLEITGEEIFADTRRVNSKARACPAGSNLSGGVALQSKGGLYRDL